LAFPAMTLTGNSSCLARVAEKPFNGNVIAMA